MIDMTARAQDRARRGALDRLSRLIAENYGTRAAFAAYVGESPSTVASWFAKDRLPVGDTLLRICRRTGWSADHILLGTSWELASPTAPEYVAKLLRDFLIVELGHLGADAVDQNLKPAQELLRDVVKMAEDSVVPSVLSDATGAVESVLAAQRWIDKNVPAEHRTEAIRQWLGTKSISYLRERFGRPSPATKRKGRGRARPPLVT